MQYRWRQLAVCLVILGWFLATAPAGRALIFSQLGTSYDYNQNRIAWSNAWNRGHYIGSLHGCTGIAIAPNWFLTAGHLQRSNPRVFDTADGSFRITEFVPLKDCDMMLCRVDRPFLRYSALLKEPTRTGQVVRVYGQSSAHWAKEPIIDSDGKVKGWTYGEEKQSSMGLREGLGRLSNAALVSFSWPFTAYDPEIGTNAAAAVHMDSGGGVFVGEALAGILTQGSMYYKVRPERGVKNRDCFTGYIFDVTNLFNCDLDSRTHRYHFTTTMAVAVAARLDQIYDIVAPPLRVNMGGAGTNGWDGWSGRYRALSLAGNRGEETNRGPAAIYETAVFTQGTNQLSYFATNLLTTELYTVRLHFGEMPFIEPGEAVQDLYINGVRHAREFDPVKIGRGGDGRAILEIRNVRPEYQNRASITLVPGGSRRIAFVSGLEVIRQEQRF